MGQEARHARFMQQKSFGGIAELLTSLQDVLHHSFSRVMQQQIDMLVELKQTSKTSNSVEKHMQSQAGILNGINQKCSSVRAIEELAETIFPHLKAESNADVDGRSGEPRPEDV